MINSILHLADIHIPKSPMRHDEFKKVFERLTKSAQKAKPDVIVIVGDIVHNNIDLQPEATALTAKFLNDLAAIAPLRITRGNHDIKRNNLKRMDSIEGIVSSIDNPNIIYYNKTGFYEDDNVTWAVWNHGDHTSPWVKFKKHKRDENQIYIDLFHDPIYGSKSQLGYEFKSKHYARIEDFKGDYSFFGDIHLHQTFAKGTKAYSSSLIAQNFGEGDGSFHGYLLWDISNGKMKKVPIKNDYSFNSVEITPYTDFDELDLEIENPSKYMRVRIVWKTLPYTFNSENQEKVKNYLKEKYNVIKFSDKKEFIEEDVIEIEAEELDVNNIVDQNVQQEIFKRYLEKIGVDEDVIEAILELDTEISTRINPEELTNIEWKIESIKAENLFSYETIDINWGDLNGIFQIIGANGHGKTTILKAIAYILYGKTEETKTRIKYGDRRYVNYNLPVDYCEGRIVLNVSGTYYGVKRRTTIGTNKKGQINGASTVVSYYLLNSPTDEFNDDINGIEKLEEDKKNKAQELIEKSIGTYNNFIRVVMTTSDTLNTILSDDRSEFIDSLIYDSGIDVYDLKGNALTDYLKERSKPKVSCNVEASEKEINELYTKNTQINELISEIEKSKIPEIDESIEKGEKYLESLFAQQTAINTIDESMLNFDPNQAQIEIAELSFQLDKFNSEKTKIEKGISELKQSYNEELLNQLTEKYNNHKKVELDLNYQIKTIEAEIEKQNNNIYTINGSITLIKQNGASKKQEIAKLKESKRCPTCNQLLTEDHQQHLNDKIKVIETEMYELADQIKAKNNEIPLVQNIIDELKQNITGIQNQIKQNNINAENELIQIGELTNDKNDVETRQKLVLQLESIPAKIENCNLLILNLNKKIQLFNDSSNQIENSKKIQNTINLAKGKLAEYRSNKEVLKDQIYTYKTEKGNNLARIKSLQDLVDQYKEQAKFDNVVSIYKKCIHRNGIPTEILKTHTLPKVNKILSQLLANVDFNVWLDENLVLKFSKTNKLNTVMDAISTSGMQRTFAAVAFKYARNEVNSKSKPMIFLLDEIMGKLIDERVDEFIELINVIKSQMDKLLIIEHNHNVNPDHIIKVTMDDQEISHLTME